MSKVTCFVRRSTGRASRVVRRVAAQLGLPTNRRLVISYLFPPGSETSGFVMAKRIAEWQLPVDVVTHEFPAARRDPGSLAIAMPWVRELVNVTGETTGLRDWDNVERFVSEGRPHIERMSRQRGRYRSVYSRSMLPASHLLAADYKIDHPRSEWTAEFSDPLLYDTRGERRTGDIPPTPLVARLRAALRAEGAHIPGEGEMFEFIEQIVFILADRIVFTNENQRRVMTARLSDDMRTSVLMRSAISPHPQPSAELYSVGRPKFKPNRKMLNIGYFGVFYGTRSVDHLISPLLLLSAEERKRIRFHIFTSNPRKATETIKELGLESCVLAHQYVSYLDFLRITTRMDWLVVADSHVEGGHEVNPYLPSKISDYRGSGVPIWGLVEAGSTLDKLDLDAKTPLGDNERAAAFLRDVVALRAQRRARERTEARSL